MEKKVLRVYLFRTMEGKVPRLVAQMHNFEGEILDNFRHDMMQLGFEVDNTAWLPIVVQEELRHFSRGVVVRAADKQMLGMLLENTKGLATRMTGYSISELIPLMAATESDYEKATTTDMTTWIIWWSGTRHEEVE